MGGQRGSGRRPSHAIANATACSPSHLNIQLCQVRELRHGTGQVAAQAGVEAEIQVP